jgi:acetylornithine/N-succinyldiaminopimelate aminotransferase
MNQTAKPHLDSHMLPVFARADVAFERGEGPWLIATNGDRYLDFTSGVAVNALGHAHPHLVEGASPSRRRSSGTSRTSTRSRKARTAGTRLCDAQLCRYRLLLQFRRGSDGVRDQDGAQVSRRVNGNPERYQIITFEGAFHGRTLATIAAGGNAEISRRLRPAVPASIRCRSAILKR